LKFRSYTDKELSWENQLIRVSKRKNIDYATLLKREGEEDPNWSLLLLKASELMEISKNLTPEDKEYDRLFKQEKDFRRTYYINNDTCENEWKAVATDI